MSFENIFNISASGMSAQTVRLNAISSNIANAESVSSDPENTYRARQPIFAVIKQQQDQQFSTGELNNGYGVQVLGIVESQQELNKRYEPGHPFADEEGFVTYPNVNMVEEMANMISASRSFQTNVDVMDTAKDMMQKVLTLGQ